MCSCVCSCVRSSVCSCVCSRECARVRARVRTYFRERARVLRARPFFVCERAPLFVHAGVLGVCGHEVDVKKHRRGFAARSPLQNAAAPRIPARPAPWARFTPTAALPRTSHSAPQTRRKARSEPRLRRRLGKERGCQCAAASIPMELRRCHRFSQNAAAPQARSVRKRDCATAGLAYGHRERLVHARWACQATSDFARQTSRGLERHI